MIFSWRDEKLSYMYIYEKIKISGLVRESKSWNRINDLFCEWKIVTANKKHEQQLKNIKNIFIKFPFKQAATKKPSRSYNIGVEEPVVTKILSPVTE